MTQIFAGGWAALDGGSAGTVQEALGVRSDPEPAEFSGQMGDWQRVRHNYYFCC